MSEPALLASGPPVRRVFLRRCDAYDVDRIRHIVGETLDTLKLQPEGKVLVKPNLVMSGKYFRHAHTRPEFADGVLGALRERGSEIRELAVGERCGITVPTRFTFREAGYWPVVRKHHARVRFFDEETQVEVPLGGEGRLRDYIYVPEVVAETDFFVNLPKFKAHPWTTVTFSFKNYIGIQDDRHRLIDHDHRLDEKVADLQEVVQPRFVAIDGIIAGQGRMLTPTPFPLGLVVLGTDQAAIDAVCCRILGLDPEAILHIRLAARRLKKSLSAEDIVVDGDVTLEQARERARGFEVGLVRVEDYFRGTPIHAMAGPPPEPERSQYCWGGCPGALEEAIEIVRGMDPDTYKHMRPLTIVFGAYPGSIDAPPSEPVCFMGDCASWKGQVCGKDVTMPNIYQDRGTKDPRHARATDIYIKMLKVILRLFRRDQSFRMHGCPVAVSDQVLMLSCLGKTVNPYFKPDMVFDFVREWLAWRLVEIGQWLRGWRYQRSPVRQREESPRPANGR
jgi:uncharacterized protein (DUF362 family)